MPLQPITVTLTDGQKIEALKRFAQGYEEELTELEQQITNAKTALAELEFLKGYLGDQPEVLSLLEQAEGLDRLEKRRQHVGMLLERLGQVIPGATADKTTSFQRF